jgi:chloramphenicol 3-O-phosphotransferase
MVVNRKAVVVGMSGCSSSGKTTLSRLLRDIFPNTFVLHEDDFYRAEVEYVLSLCREIMGYIMPASVGKSYFAWDESQNSLVLLGLLVYQQAKPLDAFLENLLAAMSY